MELEEISMNADEMMYEAGFEKVDGDTSENKVTYRCRTENDYWIVRIFKSYGTEIMNYSVSHSFWFETLGEWREMNPDVDMELHKVIHQVLFENGWL